MKYRLDQLIAERKLVPSREKARANIMAGNVLVNNVVITKAGYQVDEKADIRLKKEDKYVSRGGTKLEKALIQFNLDVQNQSILDVGSSTGGFTDCLLQHGAKMIYSVDVGYNQLDYRLRTNPQVIVIENFNARNLSPDLFQHPLDLAVIDVSFISLNKILQPVLSVLAQKRIIALIKPQFEVGNTISNFKGIVKQPEHHLQALNQVHDYAQSLGLFVKSATYSPIKGPKGNIEFFIQWTDKTNDNDVDLSNIVEQAHNFL